MGNVTNEECTQLDFFGINLQFENCVVQSNNMIQSRQRLNLLSAKVIRAVIMQIKPGDQELKPYFISNKELLEITGSGSTNLYRDAQRIVNDISNNSIEIKVESKKNYTGIPWVIYCHYEGKEGLYIQMNPLLKPYLLNLQGHYTQYPFETIKDVKSVYTLRMYELIISYIPFKVIPRDGADIYLTVEEIRDSCCYNRFKKTDDLKKRVIDVAVDEINARTLYDISYDEVKKKVGKGVEGYNFHMNMKYHKTRSLPKNEKMTYQEVVEKFSNT